jgi:hypothetical protein
MLYPLSYGGEPPATALPILPAPAAQDSDRLKKPTPRHRPRRTSASARPVRIPSSMDTYSRRSAADGCGQA